MVIRGFWLRVIPWVSKDDCRLPGAIARSTVQDSNDWQKMPAVPLELPG